MSSSAKKPRNEATAVRVWFRDDSLFVALSDGREIKVPLEFYPRLSQATKKQRENFEITGLGTGIHWPDLDEDLSIEGILLGIPARF